MMINHSLFKILCICIVIFSGFACSKKNSDPSPGAGCSSYATVGDRIFTDEVNDVEKGFLDLESLTVDLFTDSVTVQMKLRSIPASIPYDQTALAKNKLNYQWAVFFDVDGNCKDSAGDIELSLSNYKFDGEEANGSIEMFTQKSIWLYNGGGAGLVGDLSNVKIENNTIYFTAMHSESSQLANITTSTKVKFKTYLNDGTKKYEDAYPN